MPPATLTTTAKQALKAQGRSFLWLAGKLGVPQPKLSRQLDGRIKIPAEQAERMADLTGLPVSLFLHPEPIVLMPPASESEVA